MAVARDRKGAFRALLGGVMTAVCLFSAAPAFAQDASCTRADLKAIADKYVVAQTTGDATDVPFGQWVRYYENMEEASMLSGMFSKPQKIDFSRSLLDTTDCSVYTEVVVTDPKHPYVLGTILSARGGRVGQIDMLVTDQGDWLFNAANTARYAKAEKWTEIPAAERDSRETLIAAANAYLDYFNDKKVSVPWGSPCARLEGGMYTGKGTPQDSCDVGVPADTKLINRRYIVDETMGAVAVLLNFGKKERPDIHTFRVEKGKIRYVHTTTVCGDEVNCGFPVPKELTAAAQ